MSLVVNPSMEDLPDNVMVDILSRLPVKTIIHCKCVCKKWLNMVLDSYFADRQLSRSPAGFMIYRNSEDEEEGEEMTSCCEEGILKWVEVEDEIDHHSLHLDPVMSLDLNLTPIFQNSLIYPVGSVDGKLCLRQVSRSFDSLYICSPITREYKLLSNQVSKDNTYICNPITREYMILPKPQNSREFYAKIVNCFGISSLTREYKVIRIFQKTRMGDTDFVYIPSLKVSEAEVYTLGTGQWRSLGHVPYWIQDLNVTFLKGHAHWTLVYKNLPESLCAFDFDKETFEFFPSPPNEERFGESFGKSLGVLKGCLCRCDSYNSNFTVWVMKEYGIKNSWHKELVITRRVSLDFDLDMLGLEPACVIEGFKDGTILMRSYGKKLIIYCPQRKSFVDTEICDGSLKGLAYRPNFRRLRNFENEQSSSVLKMVNNSITSIHCLFCIKQSFPSQHVTIAF